MASKVSKGLIDMVTVPISEYSNMKDAIEEMNSWRCSKTDTGQSAPVRENKRCRNSISKESLGKGLKYCVAHLEGSIEGDWDIDYAMGSKETNRAVLDISQAKGNGVVETSRAVSNGQLDAAVARYGLSSEQLDSWDPEVVKKIQAHIERGVSLFDPSREIIMLRGVVDALRVQRDELTCRNCANAGIRSVVCCPVCTSEVREFNMEKVTDMLQKTGKAIEVLNKIVVNHRYVAQVFGDYAGLFATDVLKIITKYVGDETLKGDLGRDLRMLLKEVKYRVGNKMR